MLELRNVTKRYGRKVVLDNISIEFKKGGDYMFTWIKWCRKKYNDEINYGLTPINRGEILVDGRKNQSKKYK